jgi:phosphatidylserine synthase
LTSKSESALVRWLVLIGKLALAATSVVAVRRGDFQWAAWGIVLAAALDVYNPLPRPIPEGIRLERAVRLGRLTRTGIDALCFGVAPAVIAHQIFLFAEGWGWVLVVLYAIAATIGIARTKVEPGPRSNPTTQGLPALVAGTLLATTYPFFNAPGVASLLGGLPNAQEVGGLTICLMILTISPLPYAVIPPPSLAKGHRLNTTALVLGGIAALVAPRYVVFPALAVYTFWGIIESVTPFADGILHDDDKGGPSVGPPDDSESSRGYRARSTWE